MIKYESSVPDKHDGRKRVAMAEFLYESGKGAHKDYRKFYLPKNTSYLKFFSIAPMEIDY